MVMALRSEMPHIAPKDQIGSYSGPPPCSPLYLPSLIAVTLPQAIEQSEHPSFRTSFCALVMVSDGDAQIPSYDNTLEVLAAYHGADACPARSSVPIEHDIGDHGHLLTGRSNRHRLGFEMCLLFHQPVSYTHLRAHETRHDLVCRLLLEKKQKTNT